MSDRELEALACPCTIVEASWARLKAYDDAGNLVHYALFEKRKVTYAATYAPVLTLLSYSEGYAEYRLSCGCTAGGSAPLVGAASREIPWDAFRPEGFAWVVEVKVHDPRGTWDRRIIADQPPDNLE